ncbi:hypothetical protein PRIPAC_88202 [Pristionchus pacificus]|uniref:Uncharacterized protein n=1 Tax=Pristionchus pacificus TaxID=54126 RepID=A0A2A6B5K8_PRIPA|nr:hypothetical protein PRIPAC_88202 [Pristionchus pacificus]|eukprot:PDM61143.1 hypothetical protein PRIPAC_50585 [Pristionchus pacificus]
MRLLPLLTLIVSFASGCENGSNSPDLAKDLEVAARKCFDKSGDFSDFRLDNFNGKIDQCFSLTYEEIGGRTVRHEFHVANALDVRYLVYVGDELIDVIEDPEKGPQADRFEESVPAPRPDHQFEWDDLRELFEWHYCTYKDDLRELFEWHYCTYNYAARMRAPMTPAERKPSLIEGQDSECRGKTAVKKTPISKMNDPVYWRESVRGPRCGGFTVSIKTNFVQTLRVEAERSTQPFTGTITPITEEMKQYCSPYC